MTTKPAMTAAEYAERTRDELKQLEIHPHDTGALVLDTFMALADDDRRQAWWLASDADKRGLALQIIRRYNHGPDEATIALYLDQLEQRFGSDQAIPPAAALVEIAKERVDTARQFGDYAGMRQLDRVRQNLVNGARLTWSLGDLLVQSVNHPGAVYSVNRSGCSCPNGAAGRSSCWHVALHDLLIELAEDRATARDILADAAAERANDTDDTPDSPAGGSAGGSSLRLVTTGAALGARIAAARARLMAA